MARLRPQQGPSTIIRSDPASGLRSLVNDRSLAKYNLSIELGDEKNINKNPVAESSVKELHAELKRLQPLGGKVSEAVLAQAINSMNSRVRQNKLSASEAWTKRCMNSGEPLTVDDESLIHLKYEQRTGNHKPSAKYRARGKDPEPYPDVKVGEIIHIYSDRSKLKSRDQYIVTTVNDHTVNVQKLIGNQFRGRVYKVKRSDVIVTINENFGSHDSTSPYKYNQASNLPQQPSIPTPKKVAQPSRQPEVLPMYTNGDEHIESDSDEDESDDEDDDILCRYFRPNKVPVNIVDNPRADVPEIVIIPPVVEEEESDEEEEPDEDPDNQTPELRRSTRNRRPPAYLLMYEVDEVFGGEEV